MNETQIKNKKMNKHLLFEYSLFIIKRIKFFAVIYHFFVVIFYFLF